jgi:hypothetical protein
MLFSNDRKDRKNLETNIQASSISAYQECFQKWKRHWQQHIGSQKDYLKRDNITLEQFSIDKDLGCQSGYYLIKPRVRGIKVKFHTFLTSEHTQSLCRVNPAYRVLQHLY